MMYKNAVYVDDKDETKTSEKPFVGARCHFVREEVISDEDTIKWRFHIASGVVADAVYIEDQSTPSVYEVIATHGTRNERVRYVDMAPTPELARLWVEMRLAAIQQLKSDMLKPETLKPTTWLPVKEKNPQESLIEYYSNNSGGYHWLSDEDWQKLEDAGWYVCWGREFLYDEDGNIARDENSMPIMKSKKGERDMFNQLATSAYKWFSGMFAEKIAQDEFRRITGQDPQDEGCSCCGRPHMFSVEKTRPHRRDSASTPQSNA